MRLFITLISVAILMVPVSDIFGKERLITLTSGPWPPFTGEDLDHFGLAAKTVSDAFEREGYAVVFSFRPWMRAFVEAKAGRSRGSILWRWTKAREKTFYFSDPVIMVDIVFFHLKSNRFDWKTLDDLHRVRVGVVNGFKYEDAFDAAVASGGLAAGAVASQEINFKKVLKGRIDITPVVLESGYATLNRLFTPETAALFTHHVRPLARHNLYLILSRKIKENSRVMADFNRGLRRLGSPAGKEATVLPDLGQAVP